MKYWDEKTKTLVDEKPKEVKEPKKTAKDKE